MKSGIKTSLILVLLLSSIVLAAEEDPIRSISVTGTIQTKIAPDLVVWHITLTDTHQDMLTAKKRNDEKVEALVALRDKLGIGEGDFEADYISVSRVNQRNSDVFSHYLVRRNVTIRQHDLKRFDEFLDNLVSSAEMEVRFSFESTKIHEVRAETRLNALKTAREKAGALAEVVGAKVGKVLTINEHPQGDTRQSSVLSNSIYVQSRPPEADLASDRFVPGAITVEMTVYATFELE